MYPASPPAATWKTGVPPNAVCRGLVWAKRARAGIRRGERLQRFHPPRRSPRFDLLVLQSVEQELDRGELRPWGAGLRRIHIIGRLARVGDERLPLRGADKRFVMFDRPEYATASSELRPVEVVSLLPGAL